MLGEQLAVSAERDCVDICTWVHLDGKDLLPWLVMICRKCVHLMQYL